jgi:hypothetical protein
MTPVASTSADARLTRTPSVRIPTGCASSWKAPNTAAVHSVEVRSSVPKEGHRFKNVVYSSIIHLTLPRSCPLVRLWPWQAGRIVQIKTAWWGSVFGFQALLAMVSAPGLGDLLVIHGSIDPCSEPPT